MMSGPTMNRQGSKRIFSFLLVSGLFWSPATRSITAQEAEPRDQPISLSRTTAAQGAGPKPSAKDKTSGETTPQAGAFVIAPLPISSPAVGSGIVPIFAYIFPTAARSPPSVLCRAGLPSRPRHAPQPFLSDCRNISGFHRGLLL